MNIFMPQLAEKALAFRMKRVAEGHAIDERHVMEVPAEEVLAYHAPIGGPYLTFENPFGRPQLLGVEFKTV